MRLSDQLLDGIKLMALVLQEIFYAGLMIEIGKKNKKKIQKKTKKDTETSHLLMYLNF